MVMYEARCIKSHERGCSNVSSTNTTPMGPSRSHEHSVLLEELYTAEESREQGECKLPREEHID